MNTWDNVAHLRGLVANNSIVMKKSNSSKPAKQIQNNKSRNKKRKNKGTVLQQGGSFNFSEQAAAYDVEIERPNHFEIEMKGLFHTEYGTAVRVKGRQQIVLVTTTGSDTSCFANGIGTLNSSNLFFIGPYQMNDRLVSFAQMYQRYAFRKLKFIYVTRVGTTQVGSFALGYNTDSDVGSNAVSPTYATLQSMEYCKIIPFRKEISCMEVSYMGQRTWYTTEQVSTSADVRQSVQGLLYGYPDTSSIGNTNMGEIYLDYVVDFYVPQTINTNVSLVTLLGDLGEFSKVLHKRFRESTPKEKENIKKRFKVALKSLFNSSGTEESNALEKELGF